MRKFTRVLLALIFCAVLFFSTTSAAAAEPKKKSKSAKKAGVSATAVPEPIPEPTPVQAASAPAPAQGTTETPTQINADVLKQREERQKKRASALKKKETKETKNTKVVDSRVARALSENQKLATKRVEREKKKNAALQKKYQKKDDNENKRRKADTEENRDLAASKLAWMEKMSAASPNNIISLDGNQYMEYVNNAPRPYWLFATYTALGPTSRCGICEVVKDALVPVSEAYHIHRDRQPKSNLTAIRREDEDDAESGDVNSPIFFVEIEVSKNRDLFSKLELNSAPVVVVFPPRVGDKSPKVKTLLSKLKPKYRFTALSPTMDQYDLYDFARKLTGIETELTQQIKWFDLFGMIFLGGAVLGLVYKFQEHLRSHKSLWLVVSWLGYMFCVSGGMYNIIRNTPFAQPGERGEMNYIAGGGHGQYRAESYLIGFLVIATGFFMTTLNYYAFRTPDPVVAGGGKKKVSSFQMVEVIVSKIGPAGLLFGFVVCWLQILKIYSMKNGGYRMGFVWR